MRPTGKSANRQVSLQKAQDEGSREESSQRLLSALSPSVHREIGALQTQVCNHSSAYNAVQASSNDTLPNIGK